MILLISIVSVNSSTITITNDNNSHIKGFNTVYVKFYGIGQIEYDYAGIKGSNINKIMHSWNGNRQTNKGLNIIQMNKGNSFFEKKVNSIQRIINDDRPDIICISESNIKRSSTDICNHFPGYNHELNIMSEAIDI